MKRTRYILIGIFILLLRLLAFSQQNVNRVVNTFYDGQQTLRVLEYPEPPPGNNKIYRLETLAENGFPAINLTSSSQVGFVKFEDKAPYSNVFNDNPNPFGSDEAAQTLFGFQSTMQVFNARFGWKGIDGIGSVPLHVFMGDTKLFSPSSGNITAFLNYGGLEIFLLTKDLAAMNPKPFGNTLQSIGHEYMHGVIRYRNPDIFFNVDKCAEITSITEGIPDIFGAYVRNIVYQVPPQNFNWALDWYAPGSSMSDPKSYANPDTYNGQYYVNYCAEDYKPHPNSGILHKWFYLLNKGFQGSAYNDLGYGYSNLAAIDVEKGIQILWEVIPKLKPTTTYPGLRILTLETAGQLYGLNSTEYIAVQNAWCAVGVCDNNLPAFSMSPANATSFIDPWPSVDINLTWTNNNLVQEWEVQMSPKYDFSDSVQTVKLTNFTTVIGPNQTLMSTATAKGYFHPGKKVYARAKISQAGNNFCKGLNPLCILYQQFGPTHAFSLKDQKVQFWPATTSTSVKAWKGQVTWKSVKDAERYRLQVSNDSSFNALIFDGITLHTGNFMETGIIDTPLTIGQTYYARVRAERLDLLKLKNNYGAWSKMLTITASTPSTAITQAKTQKPNDPPQQVSTIGRQLNWDPVGVPPIFLYRSPRITLLLTSSGRRPSRATW